MTVYDLMTIMDKLSSLRAFVKVVELGSFSEAGRQLRLSRSAISKYVSDLEQDLGVQLLNRTTRHASPNENGQAYFERALVILAYLDAASDDAAFRQIVLIDGPAVLGWESWREIQAMLAPDSMETWLQNAIDQGFIAPHPVSPLAHLLVAAMNEVAAAGRGELNQPPTGWMIVDRGPGAAVAQSFPVPGAMSRECAVFRAVLGMAPWLL